MIAALLVVAALGWSPPPPEPASAPAGSASVRELLAASAEIAAADPARSRELAERALAGARAAGSRADESRALNRLGVAHYYLGDYQRALALYSESLRLAEAEKDPEAIANALNNIGVLHYLWGSLDRALDYYQRALALRRTSVDREGLAKAYNNLGAVADAAERYPEALDYFGRALAIYEELEAHAYVASTLNNLGQSLLRLGRLDEARARFESALALARRTGDDSALAISEDNLGLLMMEQGRLAEARAAFSRALELHRKVGDRPGTATSLLHLGSAASGMGDFAGAASELTAALDLATELEVPQLARDVHQKLAALHERRGDLRAALDSLRRYHEVQSRLVSDAGARRLAEMSALFEVEKKNAEIDRLSRERATQRSVLLGLLAATALLIAIIVLLWSRNRLKDRTNRAIEEKNRALRRAHEELERATRAEVAHLARVVSLGEMTAAVAHELNQPLSAILTNAQLASGMIPPGRPESAELDATVADISLGARRAWEVLRHLRELARRGEVERRPLDLRRVVADAVEIAGAEARLRGVEVEQEAPSEPLVVEGDPVHLQQVVLNLLQNAVTAAADGAEPAGPRRISVIAARAADRVTVSVSDTGPAVDDEVLASLFKPFFTTRADGLGMGLAISKRLVEAHDGRIWARPAGERGLVVGFDLPLSRVKLPGRPAAAGI